MSQQSSTKSDSSAQVSFPANMVHLYTQRRHPKISNLSTSWIGISFTLFTSFSGKERTKIFLLCLQKSVRGVEYRVRTSDHPNTVYVYPWPVLLQAIKYFHAAIGLECLKADVPVEHIYINARPGAGYLVRANSERSDGEMVSCFTRSTGWQTRAVRLPLSDGEWAETKEAFRPKFQSEWGKIP